MEPQTHDIHRTLQYGQSHNVARDVLPFSLGALALGLFLLTPLDGEGFKLKNAWLGGVVVAGSVLIILAAIYRRTKPSIPAIVVSPAGIFFRDVSTAIIPWNEIRDVGTAYVRGSRELFATKVTKLVVSKSYYQSLTGGSWKMWTVARKGEPSEIYLSYYYALPFDEFQHEVRLRWQAFSRHAAANSASPSVAAGPRPAPTITPLISRRADPAVVKQQGMPSFGLVALVALLRSSSPAQRFAIAVSLVAIAVLLSNHLGLWSTDKQEKGRESAAEWRARQEKYEADRKATDAEQRRIEDVWKRHKW